MVNGCFWHGHDCQRYRPATNAQFWQDKITRNRERDARNQALLLAAGWNVIVVWDLTLSRIVLQHNTPQPRPYGQPEEELPLAAEPQEPYNEAADNEKQP